MTRYKITDEQKKVREQKVIEMYKQGVTQQIISQELHISCNEIRRITKTAGIYIKGRAGILNRKSPEGYQQPGRIEEYRDGSETKKIEERMSEAIRAEDIEMNRHIIKVGSYMNIRTCKAIAVSKSCTNLNGYIRRAVVVNTDDRRFCKVRIESNGVEEYIKWQDIYMAIRDNKRYVG